MRYGSSELTKFEYANYLAVSLAYLVTKARDKIGIGLFDDRVVRYLPPSNSLGSTYTINAMLEDFTPSKKSEIDKTLLDFAERIGRRQLVILISDCLLDIEQLKYGMARLQYDRHEIVLLHVMDPYELDFPLDGHVKFKGLEGLEELKLQPKQIRKAYLEKVNQHIQKLRAACEASRAEYVLVNTGRPIEEMLFGSLTSRLTHLTRGGRS